MKDLLLIIQVIMVVIGGFIIGTLTAEDGQLKRVIAMTLCYMGGILCGLAMWGLK